MQDRKNVSWGLKVCCTLFIATVLIFFSTATFAAVADYEGTYSGTYSGGDNGIFRAIVESDGYFETIIWSTDYNEVNWGTGYLDANGNFSIPSAYGNYVYSGLIDGSGNLSGTYSGDLSGTMTGRIVSPSEIVQYVGEYAGTCTGDDNWDWDGYLYSSGKLVSGDGGAVGVIGPDGKFIAVNLVDTGFYGVIDQYGDVTGYWHNPDNGNKGLMTGKLISDGSDGETSDTTTTETTNTDGSDGGGGGGGCFLKTVSGK